MPTGAQRGGAGGPRSPFASRSCSRVALVAGELPGPRRRRRARRGRGAGARRPCRWPSPAGAPPSPPGSRARRSGGWLADRGKGLALAAAFALPAAELLMWAQGEWPDGWPVAAWAASLAVGSLLSFVAPIVLLPLFLRSEPLPPGPLRDVADDLVVRSGLRVRDVRLLRLSEKTTRLQRRRRRLRPDAAHPARRHARGAGRDGRRARPRARASRPSRPAARARAGGGRERRHHRHRRCAPGERAACGARPRRRGRPRVAAGLRAVPGHGRLASRARHGVALAPPRARRRRVRRPPGRPRRLRPRPGAPRRHEPRRAGAAARASACSHRTRRPRSASPARGRRQQLPVEARSGERASTTAPRLRGPPTAASVSPTTARCTARASSRSRTRRAASPRRPRPSTWASRCRSAGWTCCSSTSTRSRT